MKTNMTNGQIELVNVFSEQILEKNDSTLNEHNVNDIADEVYGCIEEYEYTDVKVPDFNDVLNYLRNKIY